MVRYVWAGVGNVPTRRQQILLRDVLDNLELLKGNYR